MNALDAANKRQDSSDSSRARMGASFKIDCRFFSGCRRPKDGIRVICNRQNVLHIAQSDM